VLPLDTTQQLTRGNPLRTRAFLEYLNPAAGIYTAVLEEAGNIQMVGQITHRGGSRLAHTAFIAPGRAIFSPLLPTMMDHLTAQAGEWSAHHLLADADEHSQYFDALRRAGFAVYAWQRVWKYQPGDGASALTAYPGAEAEWQPAEEVDVIAVRSLAQSLVPALVQPVEGLFEQRPRGLLIRQQGRLVGYTEMVQGSEGLWLQPFIHPETENVPGLLMSLLRLIGRKCSTRVYISVRSYQAWIESALEELPVFASPRQALLVRHLAVLQKEPASVTLPTFETARIKTGPVARSRSHEEGMI
jgi:hypothetical protein